jgi:hypothetical protein
MGRCGAIIPVPGVRALRFGELKRGLFSSKMGVRAVLADPGAAQKGEACGTTRPRSAAGLSTSARGERDDVACEKL